MQQIKSDAEMIKDIGGPSRVAEMLGLDKRAGGVQRVQTWTTRGIPPAVKLQHPNLFLKHLTAAAKTRVAADA